MATELSNREIALPYPHNCSDDNYNGVCQVCGFDEDALTPYVLAPITDRQAVNVARNTLHTLLYAADIGYTDSVLRELHHRAQPKGSDIRAAIDVLDRIHQGMPR